MNEIEFDCLKSVKLFDLSKTIARGLLEKHEYPFEVLGEISDFIKDFGKTLPKSEFYNPEDDIYIHWSAKIDKTATILPPAIICENAELRKGAFLRGSVIVGKACVVGNSVEAKNSILFDSVAVPHFNYVGDSVLGFHAHFGAGVITSNVRCDKANVEMKIGDKKIKTNRKKVGAFVGDYAEIGCNTVLNPGTTVSKNKTVYPLSSVRGYL